MTPGVGMTQAVCWSEEDADRLWQEVGDLQHAIVDGDTPPDAGAQQIVDRASALVDYQLRIGAAPESTYASLVRTMYDFNTGYFTGHFNDSNGDAWKAGSKTLWDFVMHYLPLKTGERPAEDWHVSHP
jgi:hypothetical protein